MRHVRAALVVLALSVMSLAFAGPAAAGGPTSVLLVRSDTNQAASLYYTDADYATLSELVGANSQRGLSGELDSSGTGHEFRSGVTLTWLVHDVAVWRVDRVYLDAEGGPWIATQLVMNDSGNVYDSPTVWHTATDAGALRGLFERVGLGAGPEAAVAGGGAPNAVTPDLSSATPAPPQRTSRPASPTPTWGGWAWGLAGLALGIALTMGAVRVLPRTRPAADSDATAAPADPVVSPTAVLGDDHEDGREPWSVPDVLSRSGG
jgi:hypothetical protein